MNNTILSVLVITTVAVGAVWFVSSGDETTKEIATLRSQVDALQQQAQAANDYAAIANLQAIYDYYVDKAQWLFRESKATACCKAQ